MITLVLPKSPARPPILNAFREALTATLPIAAGFLFIGAAYGFYMQRMGFSFWYPMLMAMIIFGGSLEFVTVTMLLSPFAPLQAFLMALMIQARHLFYGIAMLYRYKGMGWKKPFLIYGMCDETFALIFAKKPHPDVDPGWFMLFVTLLDYTYWFTSAALGGIFGSLVPFDTKGIDFVMTSMFIVIFVEQVRQQKNAAHRIHRTLLCRNLQASIWSRPLPDSHHDRDSHSRNGPAQTNYPKRRLSFMTFFEEAITIGVCAAATILTRFLPFFVFSSRRPTPPFMTYLGKALPPAIFAMLCVYCLRHITFLVSPYGLPELCASAVTVFLQLKKRSMMLSMVVGTVCYMVLIRL